MAEEHFAALYQADLKATGLSPEQAGPRLPAYLTSLVDTAGDHEIAVLEALRKLCSSFKPDEATDSVCEGNALCLALKQPRRNRAHHLPGALHSLDTVRPLSFPDFLEKLGYLR
jgi:hypothetical protein